MDYFICNKQQMMNWLWKGKGGDKTKDKPKEKPQEEEEVDED